MIEDQYFDEQLNSEISLFAQEASPFTDGFQDKPLKEYMDEVDQPTDTLACFNFTNNVKKYQNRSEHFRFSSNMSRAGCDLSNFNSDEHSPMTDNLTSQNSLMVPLSNPSPSSEDAGQRIFEEKVTYQNIVMKKSDDQECSEESERSDPKSQDPSENDDMSDSSSLCNDEAKDKRWTKEDDIPMFKTLDKMLLSTEYSIDDFKSETYSHRRSFKRFMRKFRHTVQWKGTTSQLYYRIHRILADTVFHARDIRVLKRLLKQYKNSIISKQDVIDSFPGKDFSIVEWPEITKSKTKARPQNRRKSRQSCCS